MFPFVNFMRMAGINVSVNTNYPGSLNANNLPNGTLGSALVYTESLPSNYFGKYVVAVSGTMSSGGLDFVTNNGRNGAGQIYAATNATLVGCTNGNVPPCTFANSVTIHRNKSDNYHGFLDADHGRDK